MMLVVDEKVGEGDEVRGEGGVGNGRGQGLGGEPK